MEFLGDFFGETSYLGLVFAGILTSLIVSAVKTFKAETQATANKMILYAALFATLVSTSFTLNLEVFGNLQTAVDELQRVLKSLVLTMAFAVLFYNYFGKFFVDGMFERLKNFFANLFGKQP